MENYRKGFGPIAIIIVIASLFVGSASIYYFKVFKTTPNPISIPEPNTNSNQNSNLIINNGNEIATDNIIDCGIETLPRSDEVNNKILACLGNAILDNCKSAKGEFQSNSYGPSYLEVIQIKNKNNICYFNLSLAPNKDALKLAFTLPTNFFIDCPVNIARAVNKLVAIENLTFLKLSKDNPSKYMSEIYDYMTNYITIENNFDLNKINSLGCSGDWLKYTIDALKKSGITLPTYSPPILTNKEIIEEEIKEIIGDNWRFTYYDDSKLLKRMSGSYFIKDGISDQKDAESSAFSVLEIIKNLIAVPISDFKIDNLSNYDGYLSSYKIIFQQYYKGILVDGGRVYVHIKKSGELYNITSRLYPNINISTNPILSEKNAIDRILSTKNYDFLTKETPTIQLIILSSNGENITSDKLCYKVHYDERTFYVDAQGGEIILDFSNYIE